MSRPGGAYVSHFSVWSGRSSNIGSKLPDPFAQHVLMHIKVTRRLGPVP